MTGWGKAAFVAVLMAAAASAAPPARITPDDYYRQADVADPSFSPDGRIIAYDVTISDRVRNEQTSDIWVVPWGGGAPRNLTHTPDASEDRPRFSPDGRWLYFLSDAGAKGAKTEKAGKADKDEDTQLWRMPAAGGAQARVTTLKGGITDYSLAPDGKAAVVVAEVGKAVGSTAKTPPPIETDRYLFKEDGNGYLDDRTQQLFVVDVATGKARQLTSGLRDHWHPVYAPDGKSIAYTAKDRDDSADRTLDYNVFVIAADGGTPRRISPTDHADDEPDWNGRPAWSPDSKRLMWLEGGEDKWIYYAPQQLAVADLATGQVTRPARIDRWFNRPHWLPDGRILALIEQDRDTWPAAIDPASGAITWLTQGKRTASDIAVAPDGKIAILDSTATRPPEIVALDPAGERALTHHNDWLADRAQGEVRDIAYRSGDAEIHGYLVLPPSFDPTKRYPLIADLHGGPVMQHAHEWDLDERMFAAAGYAVLAVNPRGSSGRGFDFSRAIYADWGDLDAKDISAGIDHALAQGIADPKRIGVNGWSYGGILTDYMIASDRRVGAAVSGAGVANVLATWGVDMYAREYLLELGTPWHDFATYKRIAFPLFEADRVTAPTLFECAGADDNVPCPGAQQMYLMMKTRGLPTHLIVYPGENHELKVPNYLVHRMTSDIAWFDRWLGR